MFDLDLDAASKLLRAAGLDTEATSVVRLFGGNNSAVFEVSGGNGPSVVVKVYSDALGWKTRKEVFVYGLLEGRGLPIAQVLLADDSKRYVPQNFLLLTKLAGQHVHSLISELNEQDFQSIYVQIGALLRRLHDRRLAEFGYIGVHGVGEGFGSNEAYMAHQFERKLKQFQDLGGDEHLHGQMEQFVRDRKELLVGCVAPVFCHNDCHEGNVLAIREESGWRVSGLLDVENALAGDPLIDISKTYSYSSRRDDATLAALTEGYGLMRTNWREALDLYLLYHALELWDWFAANATTDPLPSIAGDIAHLCSGEPLPARS